VADGTGGPRLGIDFGTTFSAMSWLDPKSGEAKIVLNQEGENKTPSAVYYGPAGVSVGTAAQNEFLDAVSLGEGEASNRYVSSIKRHLLSPPAIALPGGHIVRPVEVVAETIRKLKRDAEEGHFHQAINSATVTVPAAFDASQRAVIEAGAKAAGFKEVRLLEEPVAAALAFAREGQKVGNSILVYDLGGGTLDLAVLGRRSDGQFEVSLPPAGDPKCGGDDFELALYKHCEKQYQEEHGHGFSNGDGQLDLAFLLECRRGKEVLSRLPKVVLRRLAGGRSGQYAATREVFEGLIGGQVQRTMRMTEGLLKKAEGAGCNVDTVVLVGGSARIPMVYEGLQEVLVRAEVEGEPLKYANQDVAVALGSSYAGAACNGAVSARPRVLEFDRALKFDFVRIPAGEFEMGVDGWVYAKEIKPRHHVSITQAFEIGKYLVTQAMWETTMGNNPSRIKDKDRPVENISWDNVQQFLERLNARNDGYRYRLPTEAEWEYAAYAGYSWQLSRTLTSEGGLSDSATEPVGLGIPNAWGLYDMPGNVLEWVQDWYGEEYYKQSPKNNPLGPSSGEFRVIRGNSIQNRYYARPNSCLFWTRTGLMGKFSYANIGFRCARQKAPLLLRNKGLHTAKQMRDLRV
jgi:formylglycine-generating enzyme required for sulfatase activity